MQTPSLSKLGPKIATYQSFTYFYQNYWIGTQVIKIELCYIFLLKITKKQSGFDLRDKM